MDRDIKFRGRRADGKWLYGDLIHNRGRVYIADDTVVDSNSINGHSDFEVDADSIGQYIGKEDNAGHPIYSGQTISLIVNEKLLKGVVEYSNTITGYCVNIITDGVPSGVFTFVPDKCRIIATTKI